MPQSSAVSHLALPDGPVLYSSAERKSKDKFVPVPGAHPASYPMGTGGSFIGDKAAGA
jgi:hypothetical protein